MDKNKRLAEARFFANKPQIQLWVETGIHYSTISRIECGYIRPSEEQKKKQEEENEFIPDDDKPGDSDNDLIPD